MPLTKKCCACGRTEKVTVRCASWEGQKIEGEEEFKRRGWYSFTVVEAALCSYCTGEVRGLKSKESVQDISIVG